MIPNKVEIILVLHWCCTHELETCGLLIDLRLVDFLKLLHETHATLYMVSVGLQGILATSKAVKAVRQFE